jgi:hypothetical protein
MDTWARVRFLVGGGSGVGAVFLLSACFFQEGVLRREEGRGKK